MTTCRIILRISLCLLSGLAFCAADEGPILSATEYRRQLEQYNADVEQLANNPERAAQVDSNIPSHVSVSVSSHTYTVSYEWLKRELKQFQHSDAKERAALLPRIQQQLKTLDQQAQAYEEPQPDLQSERRDLDQILSRYEFRKAHGPGFLEIWWQKLMRWLSNFFDRHPIYGRSGRNLLVYGSVIVAFIFFAIWIIRRLRRPKEDFTREILPFAPSARSWRTWLADAKACAQNGGWRDGIHLAYWAGISFLEEQGAWRPDRARTPREYLRILGSRKPQYPVLSALTRKFEVVWYGDRDADAADFQETLGQLEKLGCR
ncbi:MAG TPA: DUF4129 domain-containing protein [Candidatus Angelobacter sp.]|nr:DUF4129 domain-containing protein [Candidatus Angelobacter sp.]